MSRVQLYTIDEFGLFHDGGEARNAHAFHMSIWRHLGIKHRGWLDDWSWLNDRDAGNPLEMLWADIRQLPRVDGLAMACTFDRCWFPWGLRDETIAALQVIAPHAPTADEVASLMQRWSVPQRGFTFASSLASAWSCWGATGYEEEDEAGRWHHLGFGDGELKCAVRLM